MTAAQLCASLTGAALALAAPASAFLVQTFESQPGVVVQQRWAVDEVPFTIDAAGSDDLAADEAAQILRESFAVWEAVATARIRFVDQGLSSGRLPSRRDRRNLVVFDETGEWLQAPASSGIVALTRIESNSVTGAILDADIIFNGRDQRFATEPRHGSVLLRDVAVHEIGHFLGLEHSPLSGPVASRPTMNPFYFGDGPGEGASLEADDVAGVSVLYPTPAFLATTGAISGHVATAAGGGVFGAHVIAEDLATGARYSTLSGAETGRRDRGAYAVRGLPPADYRLALEPVTGEIDESNFSGLFAAFDTDFAPEYYDNVERQEHATPVLLTAAGASVAEIDFVTGLSLPGQPRLTPVDEPGNTPDAVGPYAVRFRAEGAAAVELLLLTDGGPTTVPMAADGVGLYTGWIPGRATGSTVRYRVRATSAAGLASDYPGPEAWLQFEVVALSGRPLAFAVLRDDDVLGVFDTGSGLQVARVAVGDDPIQVLTSRDGRFLYVSNLGSSDISVVEAATFRVVDRIAVAAQPLDLALSTDGRTLYVSNSGASLLTAIDVGSRTVVGRIPVGLLAVGPYGVAAARDRIYVTDLNANAVIAIADGAVVARIPVAAGPRSLAASADGREVYVTSFLTDTLTVIDAATDRVSAAIPLPVGATFAVAVHPKTAQVWATGQDDGALVVVDVAARRVVDRVAVGDDPRGLSFSPAGDRLYVTTAASNEIYVVDAVSHELLGRYAASAGPRGISVVDAPAPPQSATAVDPQPLPEAWALSEVFPNPFNPAAALALTLAAPQARVRLEVYDALGQRVRRLDLGPRDAGRHRLTWDGRDDAGGAAASGLYMFVVDTPAGRLARRGVLLR